MRYVISLPLVITVVGMVLFAFISATCVAADGQQTHWVIKSNTDKAWVDRFVGALQRDNAISSDQS